MSKTTLKMLVAAALAITAGITAAKPSMTEAEFAAYVHRDSAPKLVLTPARVTMVGKSYGEGGNCPERTIVRTDAATAIAVFAGDQSSAYHIGDKVGAAIVHLPNGNVRLHIQKDAQ